MKEVWVFANWKALDDVAKRAIIDCRATDIVLGCVIDYPSADKPKISISLPKLVASAKWLQEHNIKIHLMYWLKSDPKSVDALDSLISKQLEELKKNGIVIDSILYDAEKDWHKNKSGITVVLSCVNKLDIMQRRINSDNPSIKFGVTGLAKLHDSLIPLIHICDYVIPQAYAVWFPGVNIHWSHSPNTRPLKIVKTAHETWGFYKKPTVMGLANYYLKRPMEWIGNNLYPATTESQNLELCISECKKYGYDRVAYWSLQSVKKELIINFMVSLVSSVLTQEEMMLAHLIESSQLCLVELGYDIGSSGPHGDGIDGMWGKKSQAALEKFRCDNGSSVSSNELTYEDGSALIREYLKKIR